MDNYKQYQKYRYRRGGAGLNWKKLIIIVIVVFVVFLIFKAIFGGRKEDKNVNNKNISNVNYLSVLENINENLNYNANVEANTNADANKAVESGEFSLENCSQTYSRGANKEQVALTFNVGTAKEGKLQEVINTLKDKNVKASFFARGDIATDSPDIINKIASAGFPIYNMSYNNPNFTDLPESGIKEQLDKADAAISERTNKSTKPFFRPPFGAIDDDVFKVVKAEGYCPITWTIDALDWSSDMTADSSKERILSKASNGAIILMQASNSITAEILPDVIKQLSDKGYKFVDLQTLLSK